VNRWLFECERILKKGRFLFWNIQESIPEKKEEIEMLLLGADTLKLAIKNNFILWASIVWNKNNSTQKMFGSYPYPPTIKYSFLCEPIYVFKKRGKADLSKKTNKSKITKTEWVKYGNARWDINPETQSKHPAPFPIDIPIRAIKLHSFINDVVLDIFLGSGTTALACEKLNRRWIGIEISEEYCAIAKKRIKAEADQIKMF